MKNIALHMRISTLQPTDDEVNSRRDAAATLSTKWGKAKAVVAILERAQSIADALVSDVPPAELAAEVEAAIQDHSSAFLASERPFDVGICAAAAAVGLLDGKPNVDGYSVADVLATALWSALAFQPPLQDSKREGLRASLLNTARVRALEAAEFSRARTNVDDFGAFAVVAGDEAKSAAAFKKATGDTIKSLRRNAALDREEIDFLWWTLVERSGLLKKPLQKIDEPLRLVVAGIEAAQYLRRFPCEVHRDLVLRTLDANPALDLVGLMAAVGASREKMAAKYTGNTVISGNPQVFPLLNALVTGNIAVDGAAVERSSEEWGARALLEAGIVQIQSTGPALL